MSEPLRCKILGHKWLVGAPEPGYETCKRCTKTQEDDGREEDHQDPDAEIGDTRLAVEEWSGGLFLKQERYERTAYSDDTVYYGWKYNKEMKIHEGEEMVELVDGVLGTDVCLKDEHHVKQKDMAWWKPVVHQAAEHIDCDVCQENLEGIAQEMQEVIDGER